MKDLESEIGEIIQHFNGLESLKELFWKVLGYDRVNKEISLRLIPDSIRNSVSSILLFAEYEGLVIICIFLRDWDIQHTISQRIIMAIRNQFPSAIYLVTDSNRRDWYLFHYRQDQEGTEDDINLVRFQLNKKSSVAFIAPLLAKFEVYDSDLPLDSAEPEVVESVLGKLGNIDKAFEWNDIDELQNEADEPSIEDFYFNDVSRWKLLTKDEEKDLGRTIQAEIEKPSPSEAALKAREEMILRNLRLVIWVAQKYTYTGMPLLDLIQEGNFGLMRAVENFDPQSGYRFSTYGTWWIRQRITRAICDKGTLIRIPVHIHEKLARARKALRIQESIESTRDVRELTKMTGLNEYEIENFFKIERLKNPLSVEELELEKYIGNVINFSTNYSEDLLINELLVKTIKRRIHHALCQAASKRDSVIMMLRYGLDGGDERTLEEIGKMLGLTRQRVMQIEIKVLKALARPSFGLYKIWEDYAHA